MKSVASMLFVAFLIGCTQTQQSSQTIPSLEFKSQGGIPMVALPGGKFVMGTDSGEKNESPAHEVSIGPFAIDKYEVTQDQFAKLELPNPSNFKGERNPVDQIRWSEAVEFCNERSLSEGFTPCYDLGTFQCNFDADGYRLPTEAEWEFAARAGTTGEHYFSGGKAKLTSHACYAPNSNNGSQEVGKRRPNGFGLHDMLGNVAEWCNDVYQEDFYLESSPQNPVGPSEGPKRVIRGGSWKSDEGECRVTSRQFDDSGIADACFTRNYVGFRCVRRLSNEELEQLPSKTP